MKIKYLLLLLTITTFVACDKIDENERYTELPPVEVNRNVLIEDFTGQNCPNCPKAHDVAAALMKQYQGAVITVGIHAGPFAYLEDSRSFPTFKTADGDVYADAAGITDYPSGVINRTGGVKDPSEWADYVSAELQKATTLEIELNPVCNPEKTEITIQTKVNGTSRIDGKLQIWITESGIVSRQKNGSVWNKEYVHNHIYRAAVNGVGGESAVIKPFTPVEYEHKCAVREHWDVANLAVVAFVYNDGGVAQVVESAVK